MLSHYFPEDLDVVNFLTFQSGEGIHLNAFSASQKSICLDLAVLAHVGVISFIILLELVLVNFSQLVWIRSLPSENHGLKITCDSDEASELPSSLDEVT